MHSFWLFVILELHALCAGTNATVHELSVHNAYQHILQAQSMRRHKPNTAETYLSHSLLQYEYVLLVNE